MYACVVCAHRTYVRVSYMHIVYARTHAWFKRDVLTESASGIVLAASAQRRGNLKGFSGLLPGSQGQNLALIGQNLALTVLHLALTVLHLALTVLHRHGQTSDKAVQSSASPRQVTPKFKIEDPSFSKGFLVHAKHYHSPITDNWRNSSHSRLACLITLEEFQIDEVSMCDLIP